MKTCQASNCISPVFSHNFCQRHQYLRTDAKKPKRSVLKHSDKKPVHSIDWGFTDQAELFTWLWESKLAENPHAQVRCAYTDANLSAYSYGVYKSSLWTSCFAHILNKKNYPYFRLNPANIEVVNPEFHRIVDQGTTKDRAAHPEWKFDLWDAKVLEMKEAYAQFKKDNLLA